MNFGRPFVTPDTSKGKNIVIDERFAESEVSRLPALAAELVELKVNVIVTSGGAAAQAAKKATSTIPIVLLGAGDPVGTGLVASMAQPGGNLTGVTEFSTDLSGKRLQLLKDAVPRISRVAVLYNSSDPADDPEIPGTRAGSTDFGCHDPAARRT